MELIAPRLGGQAMRNDLTRISPMSSTEGAVAASRLSRKSGRGVLSRRPWYGQILVFGEARMTRDPRVDLVFSHNLARYVATGVDPNDAQRLIVLIERWEDWCRLWSEEAARHEALAKEAADK